MVLHKAVKRGNKHRVVIAKTGRLARNRYGTVRDGGGHASPQAAQRQAAILTKVTTQKKK